MKNEEELEEIIKEVNTSQTDENQAQKEEIQEPLSEDEKKTRAYQKQALLEVYAQELYKANLEHQGQKTKEIYEQLAQSNGTQKELIDQVKKVKRIYEAIEITKPNKEPIYICNNIDDALILENHGKNAIFTELNKIIDENKYIKTSYIKEITSNKKAMKRNYILAIRTENQEQEEDIEKELKQSKIKFTPLVLGNNDTIDTYYKYCYDNDQMDYFYENIDPFNNLSNFNYLVYNFENELKEHQEHKQVYTGFKNLDFILNGINSGLYVLGAGSSIGKTTFILQIADTLASKGHKVLYFSLEQSRFELITKSISRYTFLSGSGNPLTNFEIMNKDQWNNETFTKAFMEYTNISRNIVIKEGNFNVDVQTIRNSIEQFTDTKDKPIVFIDYLQIIKPTDTRQTDKQAMDFTISELKRISRDNDIPIIVISSLNRSNYNTTINFEAFKESGAIEYSSDVVLGLQLQELNNIEMKANQKNLSNEQRRQLDNAKGQDKRQLELVGLKNRNGRSNFKITYDYYTKYNTFIEKDLMINNEIYNIKDKK